MLTVYTTKPQHPVAALEFHSSENLAVIKRECVELQHVGAIKGVWGAGGGGGGGGVCERIYPCMLQGL